MMQTKTNQPFTTLQMMMTYRQGPLVDGVGPSEFGISRVVRRRQRRYGMPLENPLIFYPRIAARSLYKLVYDGWTYGRLRISLAQARIRHRKGTPRRSRRRPPAWTIWLWRPRRAAHPPPGDVSTPAEPKSPEIAASRRTPQACVNARRGLSDQVRRIFNDLHLLRHDEVGEYVPAPPDREDISSGWVRAGESGPAAPLPPPGSPRSSAPATAPCGQGRAMAMFPSPALGESDRFALPS
jgi:hypothetical protein